MIDKNNNYWIGTTDGLSFFNGSSFQNYGNIDGIGGKACIRKIGKSPSGEIIISAGFGWEVFSGHQLFSYNGISFQPIEYTKYQPQVFDFYYDDKNLIYNTGNRIVFADKVGQQAISHLDPWANPFHQMY